jgi:hypothetical protein
MRAHWSSVSSWNRDTIPGFQNPTGKFIRHALAWIFHVIAGYSGVYCMEVPL